MAARYYARTRGPRTFVEPDEQTAWTPFPHEVLALGELAIFCASPPFRGRGASRGDGARSSSSQASSCGAAISVRCAPRPRRLGYRAEIADIGRDADCFDVMTDRLLGAITATGAPVHLVGATAWAAC